MKSNVLFNVAEINVCTETEGPYNRLAIWFQGCHKRCKGCCNKCLQALKLAHIMYLDEIVSIIIEAKNKYNIEGVTFLGGEPTLQSNLPELAKEIHNLGLGVIMFSGYLKKEIKKSFLKNVDLLIDGEFDYKLLDNNRNMIGSSNQMIYLLTDRYKNDLDWFLYKHTKKVEINICNNILFNGDVYFNK